MPAGDVDPGAIVMALGAVRSSVRSARTLTMVA
jgi:hypothetical protein